MEADMDSSTSPLRQMMRSCIISLAELEDEGQLSHSYFQEPGKDVICFASGSRLVESVQSVDESVATHRYASRRPIDSVSKCTRSYTQSLRHTTVSVTKGVGVHPRGGWRSDEGTEVEKDRAATAGRSLVI